MGRFSAWSVLLVVCVFTARVLSQDDDPGFNLSDAIDGEATPKPEPTKPKVLPAAGGDDLDLADFFDDDDDDAPPTKAPPPKFVPKTTKAPVKPKPKPESTQADFFAPTLRPGLLPGSPRVPSTPQPGGPPAGDDFDLSDGLDPNNDIGGKDKNKGQAGGSFSDSDLFDVGKDDTYKPDKGKGGSRGGQQDPADENDNTMAETGTIAGIVSAVAMALVGAVSSYISYQKKKFCFSIQQSLNADMVKTDNPDAVVATEPQVQQTLLEPPNAEPPSEENVV